METPTRACANCRYWIAGQAEVGECHALPPSGAWPATSASDWCGKFNPVAGGLRSTPKVSDETLIALVRENSEVAHMPDGTPFKSAWKRSDLVAELMERGMASTPAHKRIETMVRRGVFEMGENPWPRKYPTPGIYVWMDLEKDAPAAAPVVAEKPDEDARLVALVQSLAFSPDTAMSLRAIHREIHGAMPMSVATVSRRMAPLVAAGRVVKCDGGYYAPPATMEVE